MLKEETQARNLIVIGIIAILLCAAFVPVVSGHIIGETIHGLYASPLNSRLPISGQDEMVTIVTYKYAAYGIEKIPLEVTPVEAEDIAKDLDALKEAIESHDKTAAFFLASKLKEMGLFQDNKVFELIMTYLNNEMPPGINRYFNEFVNNYICFVIGSGNGVFVYPIIFPLMIITAFFSFTLFLIALAALPEFDPENFPILSFLPEFFGYMMFFQLFFPRLILPFALGNISAGEGAITTIGLNGVRMYSNQIQLLGFLGLIVQLPTSKKGAAFDFFCLGVSLAVTGN